MVVCNFHFKPLYPSTHLKPFTPFVDQPERERERERERESESQRVRERERERVRESERERESESHYMICVNLLLMKLVTAKLTH